MPQKLRTLFETFKYYTGQNLKCLDEQSAIFKKKNIKEKIKDFLIKIHQI